MKKSKCTCSRGEGFDNCGTHSTTMYELYESICAAFEKRRFYHLGAGSSRQAYGDKKKRFVYKIPLNAIGIKNNRFEALVYKHRHKAFIGKSLLKDVLASCKLLKHDVLRMEYVHTLEGECWGLPDRLQCLVTNDGGQIGITRKNKIVIYDYELGVKIKDKRVTPKGWM